MSDRYPGSKVEVRGWEARYYGLLMPLYLRLPFRLLECPYAFDFITRDWQAVLAKMGFGGFEQHLFFKGYVRLLKAIKKPAEKGK